MFWKKFKRPTILIVCVGARLAFQTIGGSILIYSALVNTLGTYPTLDWIGTIMCILAVLCFLVTYQALKKTFRDHRATLQLGWMESEAVVYTLGFLLPVAAFVNLGNVVALDPVRHRTRYIVWAVQLGVKTITVAIIVMYFMYYKVYAEAWHCYKSSTKLSEYNQGYCPAYTHQGSYLDPANTVCRTVPNDCYGDRSSDNIPRGWTNHKAWIYAVITIPVHITIAQTVAGLRSLSAIYKQPQV